MSNVNMIDLLKAGAHFGHQTRYWNPKNAPYIYGVHNRIHIINLEFTLERMREALNFVKGIVSKRGKVLFVGTKRAARDIIREEANRCNMPYVNHRWLGGMLTNYRTVRQSIRRLKDLERRDKAGELSKLIKKEALSLRRQMDKLEASLGGIKDMNSLPDALIVIDVGHENIAIAEANRMHIPVIGVVDTNNSPDGVNIMIPGNDDAMRAIKLYASLFADAVLEAKQSVAPLNTEETYVEADSNEDEFALASAGTMLADTDDE